MVGEAFCLQLGENKVKSSEEQFRRCLVRWFKADLCPFPYLCSSKIMVTNLWSLKRGVKKSTFGRTLLFDFEDISNIEWMLAKGSRRLEEKVLHLVKWILEVGCLLKGRLLRKLGEGVGTPFASVELGGAYEVRGLLWGFCHCG